MPISEQELSIYNLKCKDHFKDIAEKQAEASTDIKQILKILNGNGTLGVVARLTVVEKALVGVTMDVKEIQNNNNDNIKKENQENKDNRKWVRRTVIAAGIALIASLTAYISKTILTVFKDCI